MMIRRVTSHVIRARLPTPNDMRGREHEVLAEARAQLSGLAFFGRMKAGELPVPPLPGLLGFRLIDVEHGRIVWEADPAAAFYNGFGSIHGGFTATLLDTALGSAVNTTTPAGRAYATLELKVTLIRALRADVGPVRCIANAIHLGARVATSEGRILDAADRIYAHGSATLVVIDTAPRDARPAGPEEPGDR